MRRWELEMKEVPQGWSLLYRLVTTRFQFLCMLGCLSFHCPGSTVSESECRNGECCVERIATQTSAQGAHCFDLFAAGSRARHNSNLTRKGTPPTCGLGYSYSSNSLVLMSSKCAFGGGSIEHGYAHRPLGSVSFLARPALFTP